MADRRKKRGGKPGKGKPHSSPGRGPKHPSPAHGGTAAPRPPGFAFTDRTGKVHGPKAETRHAHTHAHPHDGAPEAVRPAPSPGKYVIIPRNREPGHEPHRPPEPHHLPEHPHTPEAHRPRGHDHPTDGQPGRGSRRGRRGGRSQGPGHSSAHPRGPRDHGGGGRGGRGSGPRPAPGIIRGSVDKNRKGFGFLVLHDKDKEDIFIPPRQAELLFHGDRIEAVIGDRGDIVDVKVLEHRFRELVGRYLPNPGHQGGAWVVYERKRAREQVFTQQIPPKAKPNDWVRAKLTFHEEGPFPVTADIVEVYGPDLPASADVGMIAAEYNLVEEHPEDAEREALAFKLDYSQKERVDMRNVPFITIDGETARDFDDAVYVERGKAGHVLWVAIADVSHYVTEGSALDRDARSRGTSVYFPERAFHMLPRALSENLCSLRPNEPRLALVAKMEFDRAGKRKNTELYEAVIESKRRATYTEIQKEWETNERIPEWEYHPAFELYHSLRAARADRGSIDFDLPEAELVVEPNGTPVSIKNRPRLDAHRLIEEFMIGANEAVTEWAMKRGWPFVYRVHEEPAYQSLLKFQKLAATVGVRFTLTDENISSTLADLVSRVEGHPAQALLNMQMLRSMKQAMYSSTHGIHFGLASPGYTHFTSPIRRYPDLVVHRVLRMALRAEVRRESLTPPARTKLEKDLADVCEHCSYRERLASDAERESIRLKQTRIMIPQLGDEFAGKVVGMTDTGLFVQIDEPYVEGLVSKESMVDDFYEFNEEKMIFFGRRKRRTFRVGDLLTVRALRADLDRRQIDFGLLTHTPASQTREAGEAAEFQEHLQPQEHLGPRGHLKGHRDSRPARGPRDGGGGGGKPGKRRGRRGRRGRR